MRWSGVLAVANVLAAQLNTALSTAGAFLITPAVLAGLGDSAYGGWLLMNSIIGYMRLLDGGTSAGAIKHGAGALAQGDDVEVGRVFDTTAAVFAVTGIGALLLGGVLSWGAPRFYSGILGGQGGPIFMLGVAMAIDLFFRVYAAALRTRSLYVVCDSVEIVTYSFFKLGLILYFSSSLSYRVLAYITLGEALARNCLMVFASLYFCPFMRRINPLRANRSMFRVLMAMTTAIVIIQISDLVRYQLDAAVLGAFRPHDPLAISIFGVGTRLPTMANFAIGTIGAVMLPRFAGLAATGEHEGFLALLRKTSLATGLVSIYLLTNCAVLGPQFLMIWLKKPWVAESGRILVMMLPAYFVALLGAPASTVLVSRGQLRGQTVITVLEALANLVLSVALVRPLGIYGVALGTIVPMIVVRGVLFPIVLDRELGIRPIEYFHIHARTIVIAILYVALVGALHWVPVHSYGRFILYGLGSTAVFIMLALVAAPELRRRSSSEKPT
jgi:O-antigen/teichoic acid export membrane protein